VWFLGDRSTVIVACHSVLRDAASDSISFLSMRLEKFIYNTDIWNAGKAQASRSRGALNSARQPQAVISAADGFDR
jgi:hypothetical protein